MTPKGRLITFGAVSLALAIGAGTLIYMQREEIDKNRVESTRLEGEIAKARSLLKQTPDLVKEVIIQRETDDVIREILSDEEDVNTFVRTLNGFGEGAGIAITSIKQQRSSNSGRNKEDFERVAYTLSFDATAWEMLDFLDRVETHSRFISVTAFKLSGARRNSFKDGEIPRHRIQMDLETYVYEPKAGGKEVRIDGYDHKRELLIAEIQRRADDLQIPSYSYSGARGRRDPWIDPRMPVDSGEDTLDIETQIAMVDELVQKVEAALAFKTAYMDSETIIEEMKAMGQLEDVLAELEEEVRRIEADSLLVFATEVQRFEAEVSTVTSELRAWVKQAGGDLGPSLAELEETREAIGRHVARQEYELAAEVFASIDPQLRNVPFSDSARQEIIAAMRQADATIQKVLAFEAIPIDIGGVALYEGRRPVALINGQPVAEGELLSDELVVRNIRSDQIEFAYRGLVLARPIESASSLPR